MSTQKIALSVLGVAVVLGLGFYAIKSNNKISEQGNEQPVVMPDMPKTPVVVPTTPPKPSGNNATAAEFNKVVTVHLNSKVIFTDGLNVTLKEISDSTCPKDVQCFWAGELSVLLSVSSGKLSTAAQEIHVGTNKGLVFKGYTFSLLDATASSATIIVKK